MKRKVLTTLIVAIMCFMAAGSGAEDEPKRVMNFIAVMDLNCGKALDEEGCTALTDILIEELVKIGKYTVIDRANRDKILSEQGFQQTGCVDASCSVEAGQMLGVGKIVVGSIKKVGATYIVSLQLINVQTAALELAESEECKCDLDGLIETVRNASRKLMGKKPASTSSAEAQPAPPEPSSKDSCYVLVYSLTYKSYKKAEKVESRLKARGFSSGVTYLPDSERYVVYVGPYSSKTEVNSAKKEFARAISPVAPSQGENMIMIWSGEQCETALKNKQEKKAF